MNRKNRLIKAFSLTGIAIFAAVLLCVSQSTPAQTNGGAAPLKQVQIDLNRAVEIPMPAMKGDLKATPFMTADGRRGWAVRIPGGRPIATPAYADGVVFVGGGYGSHEFYAFDAQTGALVWQMKTGDDGPTAAVVEDGCVAFNTESCTVVVADERTGRVIWQEWLGDPLMSQPAISRGRLYIAYPGGQRATHQIKPQSGQIIAPQSRGMGYRLLCADLKTGRHVWEQEIPADVISAPVINGDQVYLTCFEGTSFCLNASNGNVVWEKQNSATSAPIVAAGQVVLTEKEQRGDKAYEGLKRIDAGKGEDKDKQLLAAAESGYLGEGKGGGVALKSETVQSLDASVGFGAGAPQGTQMAKTNKHLGVNSVAGGWAYQGSRAAQRRGQIMNAQGKYLNCMKAIDGRFAWRAEVKGAGIDESSQVFSPPALGDQKIYLCSAQGHLLSVRQQDGEIGFIYSTKQPMAFQPALAQGNIYVGTVNGLLICLKTGDKDADGWYEWGGNAQHNKE